MSVAWRLDWDRCERENPENDEEDYFERGGGERVLYRWESSGLVESGVSLILQEIDRDFVKASVLNCPKTARCRGAIRVLDKPLTGESW